MAKLIKFLFNIDTDEFSRIIRESFFIIIIAIFIGFITNIFLPNGFIFINTSIQKSKNIVMISSEEAKIKTDTGSAILLDSRQSREFDELHITGAINIPGTPASIALKKIQKNFDLISGPVELVIYCEGGTCGSSKILADKLLDMNYSKHIYIIKNGINEWEDKGYPVTKQTGKSDDEETEPDTNKL